MEWKLFLILSSVVVLRDCDTKLVERSLMNFAQMIRRVTATNPFKLIGYGNWCGFGGGGQVVDSVDSCCERHDNCYDRVAEQCGSVMADYMMSYDWKVENDTDIVCVDETTSARCAVKLCNCDKTAVECFLKYHYDT